MWTNGIVPWRIVRALPTYPPWPQLPAARPCWRRHLQQVLPTKQERALGFANPVPFSCCVKQYGHVITPCRRSLRGKASGSALRRAYLPGWRAAEPHHGPSHRLRKGPSRPSCVSGAGRIGKSLADIGSEHFKQATPFAVLGADDFRSSRSSCGCRHWQEWRREPECPPFQQKPGPHPCRRPC